MDVSTPRTFTPARIVALALIVVVVGGLTYLRFASPPTSVFVPEGAKAGQIFLSLCNYPTENGSYVADCGTLVVPENRANPQSRLIALPVTRIRARSNSRRRRSSASKAVLARPTWSSRWRAGSPRIATWSWSGIEAPTVRWSSTVRRSRRR